MKKTELQAKSLKALTALAIKLGVKRPSINRKEDLIAEILTAIKVSKLKAGGVKTASAGKPPASSSSKSKASANKHNGAQKVSFAARKRQATARPGEVALAPVPAPSFEHKFVTPVHPMPANTSSPYDHLGELPESYGTGRLFFAARDPYWIYAYWDYTWNQMEEMRRVARYGELKLRVYAGRDSQAPIQQEITLNPAARNWFVQVDHANADYCAEFGYYDHQGNFITASRSYPTRTPSDRMSSRTDARFVTIPFHISFRELFEMVKAYFKDGEELADVLHRLQAAGFPFPFDYERTHADEQALGDMFGKDLFRSIRMGSDVVTEMFQRRLREETSSGLFVPSSPMGASFGAPTPRGFWLNVNAELIVYGATEPKARVVFDGKEIALKPNGTFRFQFALPDGSYDVPIAATSPDEVETRRVFLRFVRNTSEQDGVGVVQHSEGLIPPSPSNGESTKSE